MAEQVKKASHYQNDNPLYEVWRVIRAWKLNFNKGSAVKYIARAGKKDDEIMELEKAREFLALEIEAIKEERSKAENKKVQEMLHSKEPKCTFNPVFAELEGGKGVCVGTMEITVPAGADPEDIIKAVVSKLYGGA